MARESVLFLFSKALSTRLYLAFQAGYRRALNYSLLARLMIERSESTGSDAIAAVIEIWLRLNFDCWL